jgi:hypothetical protein
VLALAKAAVTAKMAGLVVARRVLGNPHRLMLSGLVFPRWATMVVSPFKPLGECSRRVAAVVRLPSVRLEYHQLLALVVRAKRTPFPAQAWHTLEEGAAPATGVVRLAREELAVVVQDRPQPREPTELPTLVAVAVRAMAPVIMLVAAVVPVS